MKKLLLLPLLFLAGGLFAQKQATLSTPRFDQTNQTNSAKPNPYDPTQLADNQVSISLCAKTYCGQEAMEEVTFWVKGEDAQQFPFGLFKLSNQAGCGSFNNLISMSANCHIEAAVGGFEFNGVDQADFALLAAHLDGTQPFTEPWQWVAADVNADGQVTLADDTLLRQLVLGIYTELPSNSSWRFIPSGYVFASPDPLAQAIPNGLDIAGIILDLDTTFLGIKIGDLNCSATPFFRGEATERANTPSIQAPVIGLPSPNPTYAGARIQADMPEAQELILELFDFSGKRLFVNQLQAMSGENNIEIPAQAMPSAGLYSWRIRAGCWSRAGKLVRG